MKKKLLAAVFGAVLVLGACGGGDKGSDKEESTGGDTTSVDAEAVVQASCISCHGGTELTGGMGPALDKIGATMSEEEIKSVIVDGQGSMPAGIIKDEAEVQAVAEWLAAKK